MDGVRWFGLLIMFTANKSKQRLSLTMTNGLLEVMSSHSQASHTQDPLSNCGIIGLLHQINQSLAHGLLLKKSKRAHLHPQYLWQVVYQSEYWT
tara:strand:- start:47839 stop:48120 length:282 start_codon:yes stop_codon:yes gene_type:complete